MKNGKKTLDFRIYKICQILKRFAGTFRQAETLKLRGVTIYDNIPFTQQTLKKNSNSNEEKLLGLFKKKYPAAKYSIKKVSQLYTSMLIQCL